MNRTEAPSAQCRSSTTSSCGRPAASDATSQYRPWRTPKDGSASPGGAAPSDHTIGAASAAAPAKRTAARLARHAAQPRLQQLPHHAPRVRALQLGPARLRNGESPRLRRVAGRHEKTRLADTRRTLHDDHASRACGHLARPHPRSRPARALARGVGRSCPDASLWPPTREAPDAPCRASPPANAHARGGASSRTSPSRSLQRRRLGWRSGSVMGMTSAMCFGFDGVRPPGQRGSLRDSGASDLTWSGQFD